RGSTTAAMLRLRSSNVQMPHPIQRLRSRLLRRYRSHPWVVRPVARLRLVRIHRPARQITLLLAVSTELGVELGALLNVHALVRLLLARSVGLDKLRLQRLDGLSVLGAHLLAAIRTCRPRAKRCPALPAGNLLRLLLERRLPLLNLLFSVATPRPRGVHEALVRVVHRPRVRGHELVRLTE